MWIGYLLATQAVTRCDYGFGFIDTVTTGEGITHFA